MVRDARRPVFSAIPTSTAGETGALAHLAETFALMEARFWEPAHGLYALHCGLLRALPQRRGQQCIDAGIGRGLLGAFSPRRLVKHQVGALMVGP